MSFQPFANYPYHPTAVNTYPLANVPLALPPPAVNCNVNIAYPQPTLFPPVVNPYTPLQSSFPIQPIPPQPTHLPPVFNSYTPLQSSFPVQPLYPQPTPLQPVVNPCMPLQSAFPIQPLYPTPKPIQFHPVVNSYTPIQSSFPLQPHPPPPQLPPSPPVVNSYKAYPSAFPTEPRPLPRKTFNCVSPRRTLHSTGPSVLPSQRPSLPTKVTCPNRPSVLPRRSIPFPPKDDHLNTVPGTKSYLRYTRTQVDVSFTQECQRYMRSSNIGARRNKLPSPDSSLHEVLVDQLIINDCLDDENKELKNQNRKLNADVDRFQERILAKNKDGLKTQNESLQKEIEDLKQNQTCKICLDSAANIVLLPCRHMVACQTCADNLRTCPVCRQTITDRIQAYIS